MQNSSESVNSIEKSLFLVRILPYPCHENIAVVAWKRDVLICNCILDFVFKTTQGTSSFQL